MNMLQLLPTVLRYCPHTQRSIADSYKHALLYCYSMFLFNYKIKPIHGVITGIGASSK